MYTVHSNTIYPSFLSKTKSKLCYLTTSPFSLRKDPIYPRFVSKTKPKLVILQRHRSRYVRTLFIRGLFLRQNQSWLSYNVTVLVT